MQKKISSESRYFFTSERPNKNQPRLWINSICTMFSKRENEVLFLISRGLPSTEIAARLFITEETVKTHRKNIRRKISKSGGGDTSLTEFAINLYEELKKSP